MATGPGPCSSPVSSLRHAPAGTGNDHGLTRTTEPGATALVASHDARFVKLARFLLDQHGLGAETTTPEELTSVLDSEERPAVVVLDVHDSIAATLTVANAAQALFPDVPLVLAGEPRAAERTPAGVRLYDKWNETDEMISAIAELAAARIVPVAVAPPEDEAFST